MSDTKKITKALGILVAAFPNNKVGPETITVYQLTLQDIDDELLEKSILHLVTTVKWFPTVSEIRDTAYMLSENELNTPSEYEAYKEVCDAQLESMPDPEHSGWFIHGRYLPHEWSHPLVEEVADIIGWPKRFPTDNPGTDRAQFRDVYNRTRELRRKSGLMLSQVKEFAENYQNQIQDGIKKLAESKRMED